MVEEIRLWEITKDTNLREISKTKLDIEQRLESFIENDISILSKTLLIIGRQVETDFGGIIDLLCLDNKGDIVIVELKRDKTPREITAQILDYASWVNDLSNERITEVANKYLGSKGSLEEVFKRSFGFDLPEVLNENHTMLIVASLIDESSERIITYLSDKYGVGINAVTFNYFKSDEGREYLAKVFLIEPSKVEQKTQTLSASKRRNNLSYDEARQIAENNGVGELYTLLVEGISNAFNRIGFTQSTISFIGRFEGSQSVIMNLFPKDSNSEKGIKFIVYIPRMAQHFHITEDKAISVLPSNKEKWAYYKGAPPDLTGYTGFFESSDEVSVFIKNLSDIRKVAGSSQT